jgi:hypothetical protein
MKWEKGKQKTGGRLPGVQNQATRDIKAIAQGLIEDPAYQASLKARLLKGSSPQLEVLLHYYAYGKPKTELSIEDKSVTVLIAPVPSLDAPTNGPVMIEDQSQDTHAL